MRGLRWLRAPRTAVERPASRERGIDRADLLAKQLQMAGWRMWVREFKFHPTRRWSLDIAFPDLQLAIEVEGYGKNGAPGRHRSNSGFAKDCEKYAELAIAGWRLIRCTTRQVKSGRALQWIERALQANGSIKEQHEPGDGV